MTPRLAPRIDATVRSTHAAWASWRRWRRRRHVASLLATVGTVLVVALPTALIPNPVFGREVPPTAWAWPVLLLTAGLSGLLMGTYVRADPLSLPASPGQGTGVGTPQDGTDQVGADGVAQGRAGMAGGLLTFLAVGCPVCNKLALLALGYAGALQWFAPVQPFLAAGGVLLLGWALVRRLANDAACPLPSAAAARRATIAR